MNPSDQPEPSLRDQLYHAMGFCPRDDHECDWSPFLTDEEKLEQLLALFQAYEEAAVQEAENQGIIMTCNMAVSCGFLKQKEANALLEGAGLQLTHSQAGEGEGK